MTYYLYVKTHTVTGLKYLGQTRSKDPHKYPGSGKHWVNHLKKHGNLYKTEIIKECANNDEVGHWGEYYSDLWNVVESNKWANLIPESGGGWNLVGDANPQKRADVRKKTSEGMKQYLKEHPKTHEQKKKHSEWNKEYWTEERKARHREKLIEIGGTIPVIDNSGIISRISNQQYYAIDKSLPIEQQEYVGVASRDAYRRKMP